MTSPAASKSGNKPGFTLLELLLVFAISAIVFLFTVPLAIRFYQNQLVDETARSLLDTLRRAHDDAMAQVDSQPHGVKIDSASSTIIHFEGLSYATRNAALDEVISYPPTVSITGTSTEVTFSMLYGTSTISDTWDVRLDGTSYPININLQGIAGLQ